MKGVGGVKKRILVVLFLCMVGLSACGVKTVEGEEALQYLLLPEGIEFGMLQRDAKVVLGEKNVKDYQGAGLEIRPYTGLKKKVQCTPEVDLSFIKYTFSYHSAYSLGTLKKVEMVTFTDEYKDKYTKRNQDEITQETVKGFKVIREFFIKQYGPPAKEWTIEISGDKTAKWNLADREIGIKMETRNSSGRIDIEYFSTAELVDDWYAW